MTAPHRVGADRDALEEERDFLLRSIADLDAEAAAGDLDPADHRTLRADYTARAARVLRRLQALDDPVADARGPAGAGAPAGTHPERAGGGPGGAAGAAAGGPDVAGGARRRWRPSRRAAVTAAVSVVVAAGLAVAAVSAVGRRDPGGVATGGAVGTQKEADLLLAGVQAAAKGSDVTALEDFESVLRTDPNQVAALTDEGWILAQTQQPQLLSQGIALLGKAERVNPAYPPAHVYLGVAYLSEADYPDAVRELQTYLAGTPDPALVAKVRQALARAQAGAARMGQAGGAAATTVPAASTGAA